MLPFLFAGCLSLTFAVYRPLSEANAFKGSGSENLQEVNVMNSLKMRVLRTITCACLGCRCESPNHACRVTLQLKDMELLQCLKGQGNTIGSALMLSLLIVRRSHDELTFLSAATESHPKIV